MVEQPGSLAKETIAVTGRLASMPRREMALAIGRAGGVYSEPLSQDCTLLVIGQDGWPFSASGRLTAKLRLARQLVRGGKPLEVIEETTLLARLGRSSPDGGQLHTLCDLSRLLDISGRRLRTWVQQGLLTPQQPAPGVWLFDFRQAAGASRLARLLRSGVDPRRIRRSLRQLALWTPRVPLESLAFPQLGGNLQWRDAEGRLKDAYGQLYFDFEPDHPDVLPASESADRWMIRGQLAEEASNWAEALIAYRRALRLKREQDPAASFHLANLLQSRGQWPEARHWYERTLELEPGHAEAWNNLGVVLDALGQAEPAASAFRAALQADPSSIDSLYNLADLLDRSCDPRGARAYWREFLRQESAGEWADFARARLAAAFDLQVASSEASPA